mmetsp:Transcript_14517/g.47699  ORF Transcript_14517/g.47699 Transcript_14517/m.47699 type:complete len:283 (+) Transcript_14517:256-1104(+)
MARRTGWSTTTRVSLAPSLSGASTSTTRSRRQQPLARKLGSARPWRTTTSSGKSCTTPFRSTAALGACFITARWASDSRWSTSLATTGRRPSTWLRTTTLSLATRKTSRATPWAAMARSWAPISASMRTLPCRRAITAAACASLIQTSCSACSTARSTRTTQRRPRRSLPSAMALTPANGPPPSADFTPSFSCPKCSRRLTSPPAARTASSRRTNPSSPPATRSRCTCRTEPPPQSGRTSTTLTPPSDSTPPTPVGSTRSSCSPWTSTAASSARGAPTCRRR